MDFQGGSPAIKKWVDDGFVIIPQAVPGQLVDRLESDVDAIWAGTSPAHCFVEVNENGTPVAYPAGPSFKARPTKLLDLYFHLESARAVVFAPAVVRFLSVLLEHPIVAFQSLYFRWGSQQDMHQDPVFVKVSSPLEFTASWIALEDIQPGSGELEYYVGSHRLDDYLFEGRFKAMPVKSDEYKSFLSSLHRQSHDRSLKRESFSARRGDALIWSADLAHGGSRMTNEATRRSIVTHYCPVNCWPMYPGNGSRMKYGELQYYSSQRRG